MSRTHVIRSSAVLLGAVGATSLLTAGIATAHVTTNVYGEQPENTADRYPAPTTDTTVSQDTTARCLDGVGVCTGTLLRPGKAASTS
ncbi:hypothetical protein [Amycolatopsis palatopharyngis]|uniref:hypothetical protein n=1 Tax=Amycolatopsis palatopharyngis TaxID=187982 RepID=UPI000E25C4D5|nr:hypothetical protein [Amycolatopsis palatopharyngis]